jgi:hypothetical protein
MGRVGLHISFRTSSSISLATSPTIPPSLAWENHGVPSPSPFLTTPPPPPHLTCSPKATPGVHYAFLPPVNLQSNSLKRHSILIPPLPPLFSAEQHQQFHRPNFLSPSYNLYQRYKFLLPSFHIPSSCA